MATRDELQFAIVLAEELRGGPRYQETARLAIGLMSLARTLHKRYEAACSYEWACTEKYEAQTERIEARAAAMLDGTGIEVVHQRDPRGAPLKLKLPSGVSNGWEGGLYCVPT